MKTTTVYLFVQCWSTRRFPQTLIRQDFPHARLPMSTEHFHRNTEIHTSGYRVIVRLFSFRSMIVRYIGHRVDAYRCKVTRVGVPRQRVSSSLAVGAGTFEPASASLVRHHTH
jgi:hypothetical protein